MARRSKIREQGVSKSKHRHHEKRGCIHTRHTIGSHRLPACTSPVEVFLSPIAKHHEENEADFVGCKDWRADFFSGRILTSVPCLQSTHMTFSLQTTVVR